MSLTLVTIVTIALGVYWGLLLYYDFPKYANAAFRWIKPLPFRVKRWYMNTFDRDTREWNKIIAYIRNNKELRYRQLDHESIEVWVYSRDGHIHGNPINCKITFGSSSAKAIIDIVGMVIRHTYWMKGYAAKP